MAKKRPSVSCVLVSPSLSSVTKTIVVKVTTVIFSIAACSTFASYAASVAKKRMHWSTSRKDTKRSKGPVAPCEAMCCMASSF